MSLSHISWLFWMLFNTHLSLNKMTAHAINLAVRCIGILGVFVFRLAMELDALCFRMLSLFHIHSHTFMCHTHWVRGKEDGRGSSVGKKNNQPTRCYSDSQSGLKQRTMDSSKRWMWLRFRHWLAVIKPSNETSWCHGMKRMFVCTSAAKQSNATSNANSDAVLCSVPILNTCKYWDRDDNALRWYCRRCRCRCLIVCVCHPPCTYICTAFCLPFLITILSVRREYNMECGVCVVETQIDWYFGTPQCEMYDNKTHMTWIRFRYAIQFIQLRHFVVCLQGLFSHFPNGVHISISRNGFRIYHKKRSTCSIGAHSFTQ